MSRKLQGAGLGFRRELLPELKSRAALDVDFFEIAPENWIQAGGRYARDLHHFTERYPFVCHGLSLSLGGTESLDVALLKNIKRFMREHGMTLYTEHLSWCTDDGHLYDLLPLPCTEEAVKWVAGRIRDTQELLEMKIGVENASYYFPPPGAEMREQDFIRAVVEESECLLHLDVNNVYVNSRNFAFDPHDYLRALPLEKLCYLHVAGHHVEESGLIIDTHGADVIDHVWALLESVYATLDRHPEEIPTCLERDFNFPDLDSLLQEVGTIRALQYHFDKPWRKNRA